MNKLAEKISDSELEVMRVLWDAGEPLPISRLRVALQNSRGWESTTVKTLVQRLVNKGCIAQEKRQNFYYRPLISREDYNAWATGSLIHKLYRGSAKNLVAALVSSDSLTLADVEELRSTFCMEAKDGWNS